MKTSAYVVLSIIFVLFVLVCYGMLVKSCHADTYADGHNPHYSETIQPNPSPTNRATCIAICKVIGMNAQFIAAGTPANRGASMSEQRAMPTPAWQDTCLCVIKETD